LQFKTVSDPVFAAYGLLYGQNDDMIVIVAVAHLRQRPNYWLDRMPSK